MSDIETLRTARSDAQSHPQAVADTLSDPLAGQSLRDPLQAAGGSAFPERAAGIASQATAGSGSALPMLGQIQSSFGKHDVSGVRAHQGAGADAANRQMGSRAFATGSDVVLGNSGSDLHTVAHEAAHVVQQRGGVQLAGGVGQAGDAYEKHADQVADAVVAGRSAEGLLDAAPSGGSSAGGIQMASDYSGLLPDHDALGGEYDYDGGKKKDFTYHHIVPENRLKAAAARIILIQADSGDEELTQAAEGLEANAAAKREETRSINLAHAIEKGVLGAYPELGGAAPSASELLPLIRGNAGLDGLYDAVRGLMDPRIKRVMGERKRVLMRDLPKLRGLEDIAADDLGLVALIQASRLDQYGTPLITAQQVATAVAESKNRKGLKKGTFNGKIKAIVDGKDYDWFLANNASCISEANAGVNGSLKNAVRDKGLASEAHGFKHAVQWNPGNIQRGPKGDTRIQGAGKTGFDALLDDGGAGFETAAVNLVDSGQFALLQQLNVAVEGVLALAVDAGGAVDAAKRVITLSRQIQDFGAKGFDASEWEEQTVDEKKVMRIKRDEERIAAANLPE